ncbi:MAG: YfcE family phosphodiesterase [Candidatus Roseilinea sp.]|uniref:YfcE family phosphodiesterase n=1 Tax=Candidatus Roseilinea sp. TaxID=2838777 RepID=UPI00404AA045
MTLRCAALIGVLSDTHNNHDNTRAALEIFRKRSVARLIHCGDVTGPHLLELFAGFQVWLVRGNNDFDGLSLRAQARRLGNVHYMGADARLDFDGHRVAAAHGDDANLVETLLFSRAYEWVFCGHSHSRALESHGATRLLNPGALGGRRTEPRSVAIIDLTCGEAEFICL